MKVLDKVTIDVGWFTQIQQIHDDKVFALPGNDGVYKVKIDMEKKFIILQDQVYVKGEYVSSVVKLRGNKLAFCTYEGVTIVDQETGEILKTIPKPKESKRFAILIQKIPDID